MIYPRTSPALSIWIILYTFLLSSMVEVLAARLPDIYWNATNPIFRIDNTDHIIDVNRGNVAYEYDQINIICPMYSKGTREEDVESYIIYNVSKEEYDSCHIANPATSRTIAVCDKPFLHRYFTITFRPFTPQPGGLEFRPGQDYYFIAMSAKQGDLNPTRDCQKYHMKVVFKVCCSKPSQTRPSPIAPGARPGASSTTAAPSNAVSSSTPSFAEPNVGNASTSSYPGVISNIPISRVNPIIKPVNKTGNRPVQGVYLSTPRPPRFPPGRVPNDPPIGPTDHRRQPYPPGYNKFPSPYYHDTSTRLPIPTHPFHPTQISSTPPSHDPWWRPHPKTTLKPTDYSRNRKYPGYNKPSHPNDIRTSEGLNSGSLRHVLTWTICILAVASAITWSHLRSSLWLS